MRTAGNAALRLLYPPRCPLCDTLLRPGGSLVCEDCAKKLPWVREPACMKCGKPVGRPETEFCADCAGTHHVFDRGRAAFTYGGPLRRSVYRMKFENRRDYLDFYADAMVRAGAGYLVRWRPQAIVPIPMHRKKRAARGYNQSELLAEKISRITGIPCEPRLLRCVRYTQSQKKLNRRERMQNLRGSFVAETPFPPLSSVLLIDDVYTTGSTLDEAARTLRESGVQRIFFLVLCTGNNQ